MRQLEDKEQYGHVGWYLLQEHLRQAGLMDKFIKCLLIHMMTWVQSLRPCMKKPTCGAVLVSPLLRRQTQAGCWAHWPVSSGVLSKFKASKRPHLKNTWTEPEDTRLSLYSDLYTSPCVFSHTYDQATNSIHERIDTHTPQSRVFFNRPENIKRNVRVMSTSTIKHIL